MITLKKELKEAIAWISYAAKSRRHQSFLLILIGFGLLVEHLLVFGWSWDVEQLFFCHGFIGLLLILAGFLRAAKLRRKV